MLLKDLTSFKEKNRGVLPPRFFSKCFNPDCKSSHASKSIKNLVLLEDMCTLTAAERVAHMIRLFLLIGVQEDEQVIGRYKKIDIKQKRLEQIKIYIACNADREIMLDTIAKHVGMNRAAFCVFFKKATGKTFVHFLNEYRVQQACQMVVDRSYLLYFWRVDKASSTCLYIACMPTMLGCPYCLSISCKLMIGTL